MLLSQNLLMTIALLCVIHLLVLQQPAIAQISPLAEGETAPEGAIQLSRESLEALLQNISPACRQEMEGALSNRGEVSDECKLEIQQGLQSMNIGPPQGKGPSGRRRNEEEEEEDQLGGSSRESKHSLLRGVNPIVAIGVFVVILFAAVTGYVVYFNTSVVSHMISRKPKKLSKKKVRNI